MEYKASNFNLLFDYQGYFIIYNTYNHKIIKFNTGLKPQILNILSKPISEINDNLTSFLYDSGYIVPAENDQLNILKNNCKQLVDGDWLQLTILTCYTCNFNCTYCFQKHKPNSIMTDKVAESILIYLKKNLYKYKRLYIEWFGGEPLVAKKQTLYLNSEIAKIAKEHRIPYFSRITTNGYELDLDTFNSLFRNNCFIYYISIDGVKKIHDMQRPHKNGLGSWDVIMKNLMDIKNNVKSRNFQIQIRVNNSEASMEYMNEFVDIYQSMFGDDSRFYLVIEKVNNWGERTEKIKDSLLSSSDIQDFGTSAKKADIQLGGLTVASLNTYICQAPKRNSYIVANDGSIYKCEMALENPEYSDSCKIGMLSPEGEMTIDTEKEKLWVEDTFPEECYECVGLPICLGKKCIYIKKIQNEQCSDIANKLIDEIKLRELSNVKNIEAYSAKE